MKFGANKEFLENLSLQNKENNKKNGELYLPLILKSK